MVLPIAAHSVVRTSFFITVEFLLAFVAMILDAIPGAWQRTQEGLAQAARGEGTPLDELA